MVLLLWMAFWVMPTEQLFPYGNDSTLCHIYLQASGGHQNGSDWLQPDPNFDQTQYTCPKTFEIVKMTRGSYHLHRYKCNRSSTFSYPLQSMKHFLHSLHKTNKTILYVGDSLTEQMYFSFLCAVESEDPDLLDLAKQRTLFSYSSYLTKVLPPDCSFIKPELLKKLSSIILSEDWFHIIATSPHISHVVFNTGAWWSEGNLGVNSESCYKRQFSSESRLHEILNTLKHHYNVTLIWRDTAPAGACGHTTDPAHSVSSFQTYNQVAKHFVREYEYAGVIPSIWHDSVSKWREHIRPLDTLHWCLFTKFNVPSIWNTLLFKYMFQYTG